MRKIFWAMILGLGLMGCRSTDTVKLQNGDIIFQTSTSFQSQAIQAATHSRYSHMGLLYKNGEQFYVLEAVQPVKLTPLGDWIQRGKDQHYVVKRLKNSKEVLTAKNLEKMKSEGSKYLGKSYDLYFEWSDDRIYCSELVWKIYKNVFNIEIGKLQRLAEFDLSNPVVKAKLEERYGKNIPKDEWVISPGQMFKSNRLETVREK